jgi:predicted phage-related endonuclease
MNTVEIVVLFEDVAKRRKQEEEKKKEAEFISKIEQLQELEELIDEAKAEAEKLKDSIKDEMKRRNMEEMKVGKYIVRWSEVLSNRFDTTAFKKLFPEVYKEFTKVVSSRRFTISG